MLKHPNLAEIGDVCNIAEAQHFIKRNFNVICYFPIPRITHYIAREAGTGKVLPFYMISFLNKASEKRFKLFRIVDIKPELFKF
jgi:hypothetical protein